MNGKFVHAAKWWLLSNQGLDFGWVDRVGLGKREIKSSYQSAANELEEKVKRYKPFETHTMRYLLPGRAYLATGCEIRTVNHQY